MKKLANHYICIGCELESKKVEAGGIHYCPNPACPAVGANNHKKSITRTDSDGEYFDSNDLPGVVNSKEDELSDDISIAAEKCIAAYWFRTKED